MVSESSTVSASIYLKQEFGYDTFYVALFLSFTAFLVVPSSYLIDKFFKEYQERKVIFILTIISFVSCAMLLSFPFFEMSMTRFFIFFSILYIVAYVSESFTSALLAKIFPPNLNKIGSCNAGFTIIFSTTGGKLAGAALVTLLGLIVGEQNLGNAMFGLYFVLFGILTWAIYYKYSDLRVKAIARIIQRKAE